MLPSATRSVQALMLCMSTHRAHTPRCLCCSHLYAQALVRQLRHTDNRKPDMALTPSISTSEPLPLYTADPFSAVSWDAILAGAAVAAAMSLVLLALGTGLGLSAISPWPQHGASVTSVGFASIVWLTVTQLCSSALGGYIAGRLRAMWTSAQRDEVHFRDTAHGLLAWAIASLATAAILALTTATALGAAAAATDDKPDTPYLVEVLFRPVPGASENLAPRAQLAEATRIFAHSANADALPPQDLQYLAQWVAQRSGQAPDVAQRSVAETHTALRANAKEAADKARRVGIQAALWLFIALLSGAFIASCTAVLGGRQRDA